MAGQQPQRGFGNQYSGQSNVHDFDQDLTDDEHARACSYVRDQMRALLGGQVPAWDGPIPGFWDRVKNQQYQDTTTNSGQGGQPMNDTTTRAQFQAHERQFREPQLQSRIHANRNAPAQGMQQQMSRPSVHHHQRTQYGMPGPNGEPARGGMQQQMYGTFGGHQRSQNGMSGPTNLGGQGQTDTGMQQTPRPFGHQHSSQNGMPGPNFEQGGQPTKPFQGLNKYDYPRRQ